MEELVDPDKSTIIVDTDPHFSERTTPGSTRVGSVKSVELIQSNDEESARRGAATIKVTLLTGDTGYHKSLIERASDGKEVSSIINMPEGTGCMRASISITAEPGNNQCPDFSEVVVGAEVPKADSEEDEDFDERRKAVEELMEAIGQVAAQAMLGPLSELLKKGFTFIVEPGEIKEPSGDFYQITNISSPDPATED